MTERVNDFRSAPRPSRYNQRVAPKAPTIADLTWIGDLKFTATIGQASMSFDSAGVDGVSPVQALAGALASCMSMDLAHVLTKGRHPLRALRAHLVGQRAQEDPHRFLRIDLHFTVEGGVPADAVQRAIALSREKYCSVWHSMRQDIDFVVTFENRD